MSDVRPTMTVGVDPGKSVGVAALLNSNMFRVYQISLDEPQGRARLDACLFQLFTLATERHYRLLVGCERFIVNQRTARISQQSDAMEVTGVVRAISPVDVELQSVADAHSFASNEKLRRLGLWITPSMVGRPDADDANSAMRQAVLLLARRSVRHYKQLVDRAS
jgi:hypothetical protein